MMFMFPGQFQQSRLIVSHILSFPKISFFQMKTSHHS